MKKIAIIMAVLLVAAFAGCGVNDTQQTQDAQEEQTQDSNDTSYAFEFTDVNGDVHKLSDYKGKPVYLETWGSWCGVCTASLEEMEAFAGEPKDYYVLTVVFPNKFGEKSEEDFIAWYKGFNYENLIVLIDNEGQILSDFGINAFPSQVFFDENGNFKGGMIGKLSSDIIDEQMQKIVAGE